MLVVFLLVIWCQLPYSEKFLIEMCGVKGGNAFAAASSACRFSALFARLWALIAAMLSR